MQTATKQLWAGVLAAIVGSLERVPGVSSTSVDFDKKTATVTLDPDKATSANLTQATSNAGFPSKLIASP